MQEGARGSGRRHRRRPRSCCASRAAPRRARRPAASPPKASSARTCRADGKLGALVEVNGETDFVAKNDDFLAFARGSPSSSRRRIPRDVAALAGLSSAARRSRRSARSWCRRSARTSPCAASSACRPKRKLAQYVHGGARSACWSTTRATRTSARTSRCTSRSPSPQYMSQGQVPPDVDRARGEDPRGAREGVGQAAGDRGQDGRGRRQQVPRRDHAARPAVREGRQADGGEDARREEGEAARLRFLVVGEGIEKKASDFAAEVMAQAGGRRRRTRRPDPRRNTSASSSSSRAKR